MNSTKARLSLHCWLERTTSDLEQSGWWIILPEGAASEEKMNTLSLNPSSPIDRVLVRVLVRVTIHPLRTGPREAGHVPAQCCWGLSLTPRVALRWRLHRLLRPLSCPSTSLIDQQQERLSLLFTVQLISDHVKYAPSILSTPLKQLKCPYLGCPSVCKQSTTF